MPYCNFSAIKGYKHDSLRPATPGKPCLFKKEKVDSHLIFTAETHNFPTGVAPFSGATTGTGGRIRDVQAVGRGGYCIAGTAGYSVGNLAIPGIMITSKSVKVQNINNGGGHLAFVQIMSCHGKTIASNTLVISPAPLTSWWRQVTVPQIMVTNSENPLFAASLGRLVLRLAKSAGSGSNQLCSAAGWAAWRRRWLIN